MLTLPASNLPGQTGRVADAVVALRNVNVVPVDTERVDVDRTEIRRGTTIERAGPDQQTPVPPRRNHNRRAREIRRVMAKDPTETRRETFLKQCTQIE